MWHHGFTWSPRCHSPFWHRRIYRQYTLCRFLCSLNRFLLRFSYQYSKTCSTAFLLFFAAEKSWLLPKHRPANKSRYLQQMYRNYRKKVSTFLSSSHVEAKILERLAGNIGKTVDASELMIALWQRDDPSNRNSLHGYIHKLRRALRHDTNIVIINRRGFGYMLTIHS